MKARLSKERVAFLGACLSYVCILSAIYVYYVCPIYYLEHFRFQELEWAGQLPLIIALAIVPGFWLPTRVSRPSDLPLVLIYFMAVVPSILVPFFMELVPRSTLFAVDFAILASFALTCFSRQVKLPALCKPSIDRRWFLTFLAGFSMVVAAWVLLTFGLPRKWISFDEVYSVRGSYVETLSHSSPVFAYLMSWQSVVIDPLLVLYGIGYGRITWGAVGLAGYLLIYLTTGIKVILFSLALIACAFVVVGVLRSVRLSTWVLGAGAVVLGSVALDYVFKTLLFSSWMLRRPILSPGLLTACYIDFFSRNPHTYMSDSVLRVIFEYPYSSSVPQIISADCLKNPAGSANANYLATAFSAFGTPGVVLFGGLLGIFLGLYDWASRGVTLSVSAAFALGLFYSVINSGLPTSLLTHGIVFGIGIVLLFSSTRPQECAS